MSFPIIYNAKDNCNITKYYQFASSGIKLETDICLKNLLQEKTIEEIRDEDIDLYTESGVIVDETNYYENLSINDPNCCISNPTAFCISSSFIQQPEQDNQSYTITTGTNVFNNVENTVSSIIQLASDNSPIFDTDLIITITDGPKSFNSTELVPNWTAEFADHAKDLLQRAVNSELNNTINEGGQSLLSIGEDTDFNNNYSLGKNLSSYYTIDPLNNKVTINSITQIYDSSFNKVDIIIDQTKIKSSDSVGSYKIVQEEANVKVGEDSTDNISYQFIIGNTENNDNNQYLSEISTLDNDVRLERYLDLINDVTDANSFRIEVVTKNDNSGLNFDPLTNDNNLFTIDNTPMIDNLLFMENIVYNNGLDSLPINLEITQNDMYILPSDETDAYMTNLNYLSLSQNGESLGENEYNADGEIVLNIASIDNRVSITDQTIIEEETRKFTEIFVEYDAMSELMKTTENVSYEIINIASPTGNGQYGSAADNNGASLYANTTLTDYNNINLTSGLVTENDEIIIIKVSPLASLSGSDPSEQNLYILNNDTIDPDIAVSAHANVSITGNGIQNLRDNDDLRILFYPKTLSDLNIATEGDEYTNPIEVLESTLADQNPTNNWLIGYSNDTYPYITSASSIFTKFNIFPSLSTYITICKNRLFLDLNITYSLDATNLNLPKITVSHDGVSGVDDDDIPYNINAVSIDITGVSVLQNVNPEILTTVYELMSNVSIGTPSIQYKQVKKTTVSTYNAIFDFNLAGFNNIKMMTPNITSTIEEYIYYSASTSISISVIDRNGSNTLTASNSPSRVSSTSFPTDKSIKMTATNDQVIQTKFMLSQRSITPLFGQLQGRNKDGENSYTSWENIGNIISSIDPYQNLTIKPPGGADIGYEITVNIFPISTSNDVYGEVVLEFSDPYYFTPLILNNAITTGLVSGYNYNVNTLYNSENYSIEQLNPNYYLDNALIPFGTVLNLNVEITYNSPDATEGNATYGATMVIKEDRGRNNGGIVTRATITSSTPSFNSTIVIAKINKSLYSVKKTIGEDFNTVSLIGDDVTNMLDLGDGVTVKYDNSIAVNDFINFYLNADKIAVNLTGVVTTTPSHITSLEYSQEGSETINIPFYRGYASDDTSAEQTLTYTIKRSNLTEYVIKAGESAEYVSDTFTNIYVNSTNEVSFNNVIGSIGTTFTSLFSRLPSEILIDSKKVLPIFLRSDSVRIIRNLTPPYSEEFQLSDYKLYQFVNGEVLKALNLRVSSSVNINDYYELVYSKSQTLVYYNSNDIGNPADITDQGWGTKILEIPFIDAKIGVFIDQTGKDDEDDEERFLFFRVSDNTRTNSTTFIVIATPQMFATQLSVDGVVQVPFDTTNSDFYDENKLITMYFPITDSNVYNPFSQVAVSKNVNNITFTGFFEKNINEYSDPTKNYDPSYFTIIGSSIEIKEVSIDRAPTLLDPPEPEIVTPTTNGPNGDGIIFSGLISDLLVTLPEINIYSPFVRTTVEEDNKVIKLSYTQESNTFFEDVFGDNPDTVKPEFNIKLTIDGFFIEPGEYKLVSSITKGIQTCIYDMVKRENSVVLLKYECFNIDFTNMPKDSMIKQINFVPTAVYTSIVSLPVQEFGEKYLSVFNNITRDNLSTNGETGEINWTQLTGESGTALINNFCLNITAINGKGLENIIELLFATSEIPQNFTVIKQPNAIEILATDGTPKFIITPFGQILTSSINVKSITFFESAATKSSNIELVETNSGVISEVV